MLTAKLKSLLNGGAAKAGPEGLQLEIDALEAEKRAAREELTQIPARRAELAMFAENDGKIDEIERREAKLYRDLDRVDLQIAALAGRLTEQRNLRRKTRIDHHRKEIRSAAEKLGALVEQAIAANEAAIAAFEAATAELGAQDSFGLFERVHFGGLLNRECLEIWKRSITASDSPPPAQAPIVRMVPPRIEKKQSIVNSGGVRLGDELYRPGPRVRAVRPALPDVVPVGHVRVRVLRSGYEGPTGEQLSQGDDVDLPSHIATEAARHGAVQFIGGDQ